MLLFTVDMCHFDIKTPACLCTVLVYSTRLHNLLPQKFCVVEEGKERADFEYRQVFPGETLTRVPQLQNEEPLPTFNTRGQSEV